MKEHTTESHRTFVNIAPAIENFQGADKNKHLFPKNQQRAMCTNIKK